MTRPLSITVVAWVIIAISIEGLIGLVGGIVTPILTSGAVHVPFSLSTTLWVGGIGIVVNLLLGALILSGFGWARIAYVVILTISIVGTIAGRQPISLLVISGLKLVVFSYFFFRREANEYFAKCASGAVQQSFEGP